MNGKKLVIGFVVLASLTAVGLCFWIKKGYDSRPDVKVEEEK